MRQAIARHPPLGEMCALDTHPLEAIANWTDQYRFIWQERFDAMSKIIKQMKE